MKTRLGLLMASALAERDKGQVRPYLGMKKLIQSGFCGSIPPT